MSELTTVLKICKTVRLTLCVICEIVPFLNQNPWLKRSNENWEMKNVYFRSVGMRGIVLLGMKLDLYEV
jgi:hypothetical protein